MHGCYDHKETCEWVQAVNERFTRIEKLKDKPMDKPMAASIASKPVSHEYVSGLERERDKLIRTLKCSGPSREICAECSEVSRVGFAVPNDIWQEVIGNENILCLRCFTRKADFMYIEWDKDIQFFPVSKVTHREVADSWYKELSEKDELIKTLESKIKDCDELWKDAVQLLQSGGKEEIKKYLGEVHNSCPGCGDHLGQCGCRGL